VCLRLRDTIEALFPDKVAARRREVAKAAERRKQQQQQARSAASTQQAALRGALRGEWWQGTPCCYDEAAMV
jgi:hypothetical protein